MKRNILCIIAFIQLFLAACRQDEFSFVFLPDLHLRPEKKVEAHFDGLAAEINSLDPDFILTGGDMIYTAKNVDDRRAEILFSFMDRKLSMFRIPVYYTMGNHETVGIMAESGMDTTHPMWGKRMYDSRYGKRNYSFMQNGWKFIVLDGIKVLEKERNYTQGIDSADVEWLKKELKATDKSIPLVISIHTPLLNPHAVESNKYQLLSAGNERILKLFKEHNLKMVLEGHTHLYMNLLFDGVQYISGGSTAWSEEYDKHHSGFVIIRVRGKAISSEFINFP